MRIESGPTGERKVRTFLMLLMFAVFSVWFAYDGWKGYPYQNYKEHLGQLSPEERETAGDLPVYPDVNSETWERAKPEILKADPWARRKLLEETFGGKPSYESGDVMFYFGPAYRVRIALRDGHPVEPMVPDRCSKSTTDVFVQKILAVLLALLSLYLLWFFLRVRATWSVLDDAGLSCNGKAPITWDEMTRLETGDFARKGWVDLVYVRNGVEQKLRLDEYHFAAFDDMIDEICARKKFENPLPVTDVAAKGEA